MTPGAKKSMELALREALARGDRHIGAEHVLLGVLRDDRADAVAVLGGRARRGRRARRAQPGQADHPGRRDQAQVGGVVADAEGDLLVGAGGERLLAGAVGVGLGR